MTPFLYILIGGAVGAVMGLAVGWMLGFRKASAIVTTKAAEESPLEKELRAQLLQRESDLAQSRNSLAETSNELAAAEANRGAVEKILAEQKLIHEKSLAESKLAQTKALADLRDTFKALSADALKESAPEFLRLAEQSFGKLQESAKGDLDKRQESIKVLVEPLKQQLETYQRRLAQSETTQSATLGEVKKQLETLSLHSQSLASETQQFRMVLKSNQARGRWGEETLRRVVEAAGMSAHCDFSEQIQSGDAKPDLIVRLPGDRVIIIDAKVPDLDFLTAIDSADQNKRAESLLAHATKLKSTIKSLADRDYCRQFPNSLDYVVLFLPAESLFSAALEGDHDLMMWAQNKRIIIATPCSLIAILRSVSVSWQQHAQTENAREIADAAQELFTRVAKFTEHFEKIRTGLERANSAYNDAIGSYERMVRPSGEKLSKLSGGINGKELADIAPMDATLRLPPN
ncbi:MAG: DNA recombination protein RmuC [Verrucomicrobiota bacterium]